MARTMVRKALSKLIHHAWVKSQQQARPGLGTDLLFKNPEDRLARKLPTRLPKLRRIFGA